MSDRWPELDWVAWRETARHLHLITQMLGKVRLACTPWLNHSWHVVLYPTAWGLTTGPIPAARDWDGGAVRRFHRAPLSADRVFQRFSGRMATRHPGGIPGLPDPVTCEAYSDEEASAGFWPGSDAFPHTAFYAYAYPAPSGYADAAIPAPARYDQAMANGCSTMTRSDRPPIPMRCCSPFPRRPMTRRRTSAIGIARSSNAIRACPGVRAWYSGAMAEFSDSLSDRHCDFIARQPVFFVATAADGARINLSPKGMDSFRVLDARTVAWLDVAGSGNETNAHLLADGRITVMFCAFEQPALILRLYGRGVPVLPQDADWPGLARHFALLPGTRQIFRVALESVQTSCGWGVPLMTLDRPRETLSDYHRKRGDEARFAKYAVRTTSIDGLPVRNPSVSVD